MPITRTTSPALSAATTATLTALCGHDPLPRLVLFAGGRRRVQRDSCAMPRSMSATTTSISSPSLRTSFGCSMRL